MHIIGRCDRKCRRSIDIRASRFLDNVAGLDAGLHLLDNRPFQPVKEHGEGGAIVGAPVAGRVLILDDVITAGTAIRETITLLRQAGGEPAGVVIALDRQERGNGDLSAIQEVEQNFGIPVASIIRLDDLVEHLESSSVHRQFLPLVQDYRERYGVSA